MSFLFAAILLVCLIALVIVPLRREADEPAVAEANRDREDLRAELAELEARKEARYREIRDAEVDHAAGKIDDADFERLSGELKAEAAEVLKRIDRVRDGIGQRADSG